MAYKEQKQYRLPEYNYGGAGIYFVTICVKDRLPVLSTVGTRRGTFLHDPTNPHENGSPHYNHQSQKAFELILSPIGEVARHFWQEIPNRFPAASLNKWVIMPDHIHGLIQLGNGLEASQNARDDKNVSQHVPSEITRGIQPLKFNSLSSIINHFKGNVKRWCNQNGYEEFFWQPRFYDHIVRNDQDLIRIRAYIQQNPERWVNKNNL